MGLSENSVPLNPMVLLIIIPIKWLFHWEYTLFSDIPICLMHKSSFSPCSPRIFHHVVPGTLRSSWAAPSAPAPLAPRGAGGPKQRWIGWDQVGPRDVTASRQDSGYIMDISGPYVFIYIYIYIYM